MLVQLFRKSKVVTKTVVDTKFDTRKKIITRKMVD